MSTFAQALSAAKQHIPAAEARLLLCEASGHNAAWLVAHDTDDLPVVIEEKFMDWIARRAAGEPVAYLIGWRDFYEHRFHVAPGVLIPRPETELLIDHGLATIAHLEHPRILDMGTGSGCIAISLALAKPASEVWALDISHAALSIASANAERLGAQVQFRHSDWASALPSEKFSGYFDLIVSNPPYIAPDDIHLSQGDLRFEPRSALAADDAGMADLTKIVAIAKTLLKPNGVLLCEHGYDQAERMNILLKQNAFETQQHLDLSSIIRISGGINISPAAA